MSKRIINQIDNDGWNIAVKVKRLKRSNSNFSVQKLSVDPENLYHRHLHLLRQSFVDLCPSHLQQGATSVGSFDLVYCKKWSFVGC